LNLIAKSFTPWFKIIAEEFLVDWWDTLLERRNKDTDLLDATTLVGLADGNKVIHMV
jgi:isopentenyl-diphosphate Delta-isomerase